MFLAVDAICQVSFGRTRPSRPESIPDLYYNTQTSSECISLSIWMAQSSMNLDSLKCTLSTHHILTPDYQPILWGG